MQRADMLDKVLLFLIGLIMYGLFSGNNMEVVPAIISVIAIGLATYFENSKNKYYYYDYLLSSRIFNTSTTLFYACFVIYSL